MNGRILSVQSNGQRRVAQETVAALGLKVLMPPAGIVSGVRAHIWEQTGLPARLKGAPLWSPSTSAPMFYRNQVVTVHDLAFVDVPQFFTPSFNALYRTVVRRAVHSARLVVAVSEFSRRRIIEEYGIRPEKVRCIYPGVSPAYFRRSAAEIAALRSEFGLQDHPYLVAMAVNDQRKNFGGILSAWNALGNARGDARLVLFGREANPRVFAVGQATAAGVEQGVIAIGKISDEQAATLLSGARGFVFPSFYEGFGLPIIEASACGTQVLTSNRASMPEIAPAGSLLVDPFSMQDIAEGMLAMLSTSGEAADSQSLIDGAAAFSWTRAAELYRTVFRDAFG